tara:strand:- start:2391 stop:3002 length:612 start_codon:yes stop_codon:yes gene_type:complete
MNKKHEYLIKTIFIVVICGLVLGYAGNYMLYSSSSEVSNNITTCDKDLLAKIATKNAQPGYNGYIVSFTGQVITFFGVLFLLLLSSLFSYNKSQDKSVTDSIKTLFSDALPVFVTLIVITYLLYVNVSFKERLINGNMANELFNYLFFSGLVLMVQVILLLNYMSSQMDGKETSSGVIYMTTFINLILIGIMFIILNFFSTDG